MPRVVTSRDRLDFCMRNLSSTQSGFNLLELIITMSLSSFVFIGSSVFMGQTLSLSARQKAKIDLMDFKRITLTHLNNDIAFKETSNASGFSCLIDNTCNSPKNFDIKTASGSTYYGSTNQNQGVSERGVVCDTYPSADCNLRLQISFTDVCPSCATKLIRINGVIMASNFATDILGKTTNLNKFNFELIRNVSSAAGTALPVPPAPAPTIPPIAAAPPTPTVVGGRGTASSGPCTGRNAGDVCENNDRGEIIGPSHHGGR